MDMKKMMKQAQKMQAELARAQAEIAEMSFTAQAGGGAVEATARGDNTLSAVSIDPAAVDPDDVSMLEDLVVAAVNEALRGIAAQSDERLGAVTGGMGLPGMPKLG